MMVFKLITQPVDSNVTNESNPGFEDSRALRVGGPRW